MSSDNYQALHPVVSIAVQLCLSSALLIAFTKAVISKYNEERVMVLDYLTGVFICLAAFQSINRREELWLQVGALLAIIAFAATAALARYLEKGPKS